MRTPTPADPEAAKKEAGAGYARFISAARQHHESVLGCSNRSAHSILQSATLALQRIDQSLAGPVNEEMATLASSRAQLDNAARKANDALDAQAALARRQILGAAGAARARIHAAAAKSNRELEAIKHSLLGKFEDLYAGFANDLTTSAANATQQLQSEDKKNEVLANYPLSGTPEKQAMNEASRAGAPGALEDLAAPLTPNANQFAEQIRGRAGEHSQLRAGIDKFMKSLRHVVTGEATESEAAGDSLAAKGQKAVDHAQAQALSSVHQQIKAGKETIRHARQSGEQQLAAQRSAAFARLTGMRRDATAAVRGAASDALKTLASGARTGLPSYGDSTRRLAATLNQAAAQGPEALTQTARDSLGQVGKVLADGRTMQERRIAQVEEGAKGSMDRDADRLPVDAVAGATEFDQAINQLSAGLTLSMSETVETQTQGFSGLAGGVSSSAAAYTESLAKMFASAIKSATDQLQPSYDAEKLGLGQTVDKITADFKAKADHPFTYLKRGLDTIGVDKDKELGTRAKNAYQAIVTGWTTDESGFLTALRGATGIQARSIEAHFEGMNSGTIRAWIEYDHDRPIGGLNDDQYHAALRYLEGDTAGGAKFELESTVHWYGGEGGKAEDIMRSLTAEEQQSIGALPVAAHVRESLSGTDLKVFDALSKGQEAIASAYRKRDHIDEARREGDNEKLFKALGEFSAPVDRHQTAAQRKAELDMAFAQIQGATVSGPITAAQATEIVRVYATRKVDVEEAAGESTVTVTLTVEGADLTLANSIVMFGPNSDEAKAARLFRETKVDGNPNVEKIEDAVLDPRLNPSKTPELSPEVRKQAQAEQDHIFLLYAKLAQENGTAANVQSVEDARKLAEQQLRPHFGESESQHLGADYVASIVNPAGDAAGGPSFAGRPDPVVALRYAMVGAGTDEELIHRTLQGLSRAEIEQVRVEYKRRYGDDLFGDLGVFNQGSFGELSGDDRLQAERELLGAPQNAKDRAEIAIFTQQQQRNETGAGGKYINEGSAEDRTLSQSEQRLRSAVGGAVVLDDFGRPTIHSKNFDDKGDYVGPDKQQLAIETNFAQVAAENYSARIDRITNYITTAIAILGAVVATVVTGGAGAPLLAMAIAGATGALAMGASYVMKGGRYGWEQAVTDLGMTAVQMVTAGVGQVLGAAAKGGAAAVETAEAVEVAEGVGATAAKAGTAAESSFGSSAAGTLKDAIKTGAITGGIGGVGGAALDEHTWDKGIGAGLGNVILGGARGALTGSITAAVTGGLERIPAGGSTVGEMLQNTSTKDSGLFSGGLKMLGAGGTRGLINAAGGMAGKAGEVGFDATTGRFHGNLHDALSSVGEGGAQPLLQGFLEGAGQTAYKPHATPGTIPGSRPPGTPTLQEQAARSIAMPGGPVESPFAAPGSVRPMEAGAQGRPVAPPGVESGQNVPPGSNTIPETEAEAGGPGGPGGPPRAGGGMSPGEPERLFPNITDAEMDALFGESASGPRVRAPAEELALRLPRTQGGYWGVDPATGMTVQEYRFLASRGLPALDPAGNPIAGPNRNVMTRMRVHSPDPGAPAGSASREGWTLSIEQGNARLTSEGHWFDTRYSETPTGQRIDVRPYSRGAAGEWIETVSGHPVTDAETHAALEQWDHNMAASHIPLFPEAARPTPPPPPATPPPEQAARGITGSKFRGDVAEGNTAASLNHVARAVDRLVDEQGLFAGRAAPVEGDVSRLSMQTRSGETVTVRIETGQDLARGEFGEVPVAEYTAGANKNEYVIRFAKGAPASAVERALAHELTEISAIHQASDEQSHALAPGAKSTHLSPHDEGRLAELHVLSRQILEAQPGSPRSMALWDEAQRLVTHLGLTGEGEGVKARLDLARNVLGTEPARFLMEQASAHAGENPFLQKLTGAVENDLPVLARRLQYAEAMGETGKDYLELRKQVVELAGQAVVKQGIVYGQRGKMVHDPMASEAIRARLGPQENELLGAAISHAMDKPTTRPPDPGALDPHTVEAVRAAYGDELHFQDWPEVRAGYFGKTPLDEIDPETARWLFDKWAAGSYIGPTGKPRSLFSGKDRPDPGFEHVFEKYPEPRPDLNLLGTDTVRLATKAMTTDLTVDDAVLARNNELAKAAAKQAELDQARLANADEATLKRLQSERNQLIAPANKLSEAFGMAAGRAFALKDYPGGTFVELPRQGANLPDLIYVRPDGRYIVIECKGGSSELGTRLSGSNTVEQGHIEYLRSLAEDMATKSTDKAIRDIGRELSKQLASDTQPEYWVVQQPFDGSGQPTPPTVGKFRLEPKLGDGESEPPTP